ncbi:WS/DGAT domain-containing protein [Saccharopolyspora sp. NPDC000995]
MCNLVVSNVPPPAIVLAVQGTELHEVYAFVPLAPRHAIGIAACSHAWETPCAWASMPSSTPCPISRNPLPRELDELARRAPEWK